MTEYPIQLEKVHAPPLRDDVLTRDRLLDALQAKVKCRVTLVIAEAGYGKTTLLADFARRTQLRVAWYRLDRGDQDWVGFIAHLVAAFKVGYRPFGRETSDLIGTAGSSAPPMRMVLDMFIRELSDLPPEPAVLILDDFHAVEDSPDVGLITDELISRAPERLRLVIGARHIPRLHLARLRSLGEVAEVGRDALRFDRQELLTFLGSTATGVDERTLNELEFRTEGWPASLQLIKTASRDRDAIALGALVRGLGSAASPMYDYLAEEVLARLAPDLQDMLMRTSILESITPGVASVVAAMSISDTTRLMNVARSEGLFARVSLAGTPLEVRSHPLVRAFLQHRLQDQYPAQDIVQMHLAAAAALEVDHWRLSCTHYLAADEPTMATSVVTDHLREILGTGAYNAAADLLVKARAADESFAMLVIGARVAMQKGDASEALAMASRAHALRPNSAEAATTLISAKTFAGDVAGAVAAAEALESEGDRLNGALARAYRLVLSTSVAGRMDKALRAVEALIANPDHAANPRYPGISLSNFAYMLKAMGEAERAVEFSTEAVNALAGTAAVIERVSAHLARSWGLAHLGEVDLARREIDEALAQAPAGQRLEVLSELAEIEFYYGDADRAFAALDQVEGATGEARDQAALIRSQILASRHDFDSARSELGTVQPGQLRTSVAFEARRQIAAGYISWAQTAYQQSAMEAESAARHSRNQGAHLWELYSSVLRVVALVGEDPCPTIRAVGKADPAILSMAADLLSTRLGEFDSDVLLLIEAAIRRHPERWRRQLRANIDGASGLVAQKLLAGVGDTADILLLTEIGRAQRSSESLGFAKALARRLGLPVHLFDLGRVRIRVGANLIEGSAVRRKVLALLCYLATKPGLSASREDVCEALWRDLDPDDALNSLNQTAYFLRRLFEPGFKEALSPGYLHQDGETIWLDQELVSTQSGTCRSTITSISGRPSLLDASRLLDAYTAQFALDFAYEDWAAKYREPLHATALRIVEQAIRAAASEQDRMRAITVAERALVLEPDAETVQAALIGLYQSVGAHAAAAEQYALYSATLRSLGLDAPAIREVR
jgi:LuxR family maltose regulon positive regulatory protein